MTNWMARVPAGQTSDSRKYLPLRRHQPALLRFHPINPSDPDRTATVVDGEDAKTKTHHQLVLNECTLLEDYRYNGSRHFDAHALRTSDMQDVKDFARGCMRTYMILKEKVARWNADGEIQGLRKLINQDDAIGKLTKKFSAQNAKKLLSANLDRVELAKERLPYEKLDQLTMEVLMGVR